MTAPGQQVIPVPGVGQDLQQAIAPFVQAMQFQRQLQRQQREDEMRTNASLLAHLLQQPGAEDSPSFQELAVKLGVPGLGEGIKKARAGERQQKLTDINTYVENLSGANDVTKASLRATLIAGNIYNAPAEVQNSIYTAMGGEVSALERARIDNLQAETSRINEQIVKMRREPGPQDQATAAKLLGINPNDSTQFVQGLDYISVLQDTMKQRETDPAKVIFVQAVSHMSSTRDIGGNPMLTPEQAWANVLNIARNAFPATTKNMQLTPDIKESLQGTHDALQLWSSIKANSNSYEARDGTITKFKSQRDIREWLDKGMRKRFPLMSDEQRATALDVIQRQLYSSFEQR